MHIFISHAVSNRSIAQSLAEALEAAREDITTFIASCPGDIRADENWLGGIERALQEADTYIILLTPESVLRPWVSFESGAACIRLCFCIRTFNRSPRRSSRPLSRSGTSPGTARFRCWSGSTSIGQRRGMK